jgi:hypothetical protein
LFLISIATLGTTAPEASLMVPFKLVKLCVLATPTHRKFMAARDSIVRIPYPLT